MISYWVLLEKWRRGGRDDNDDDDGDGDGDGDDEDDDDDGDDDDDDDDDDGDDSYIVYLICVEIEYARPTDFPPYRSLAVKRTKTNEAHLGSWFPRLSSHSLTVYLRGSVRLSSRITEGIEAKFFERIWG